MKRIVLIGNLFVLFGTIFIILSVAGMVLGQAAEIPNPFDKALEMVQGVEPDIYGRKMLVWSFSEVSHNFTYVFGYLGQLNIIGIGIVSPKYIMIEYHIGQDIFTLAYEGGRIQITRETAIKAAYGVFEELVKRNLI